MNLLNTIKDQVWPQQPQQSQPQPPRLRVLHTPKTPQIHHLRLSVLDTGITIFGFPSRGGLIVLERANAIDFDFLGLSRLDPPITRSTLTTEQEEDSFCKELLKLGATWFDSLSRWQLKKALEEHDPDVDRDNEHGRYVELTLAERVWVEVGWAAEGTEAGLWVGVWDTNLPGIMCDELVPMEIGLLGLAVTMAERCVMLEKLGARFYRSVEEYDGPAGLRAWELKLVGEVEPLEQMGRLDGGDGG